MIKQYIDRLVTTYPTEIATAADMLALAAPVLLVGLAVWLLAVAGQWLIDWNERRCIARAKRLHYRTANARQIQRETEQLWYRTPGASASAWEPWHDTVPPVQDAPRAASRVRAGPPQVVAFPSPDAQQRRRAP